MAAVLSMRPARRSFSWSSAGLLLFLALFALIAGLATAVVGSLAAIGAMAMIVGVCAFFLPLPWLVVALFAISFVVTGQVIYFARFDKALWFPFLVGALLLVRFPIDRMLSAKGKVEVAQRAMPWVSIALAVYFATVLASSAINRIGPLQLLVTSKEYLFLWGLYLILAVELVGLALVRKIWRWLPWLVVAQLPLILYQRLVVVPARAARALGAEWDAVVGAFGGNPDAGGSSGAMGIFCTLVIVLAVARWRQKDLSGRDCLMLIGGAMLSLAMAEVKFAILLIPVAFSVLFLHEILRRPFQGLLAIALAVVLSLGVLAAYKAQYSKVQGGETLTEYFEGMFSSSTDDEFVNLRTREIGRVAAITFWSRQHGWDSPSHFLIGHGIGSSRIGETVVGEAARKWPFNIARSALAILLWEVGLVGATALVLALLAGAWRGHHLAQSANLAPGDRALASGCAVALVLAVCALPYNTDLMYAHQTQIITLLSLGTLLMLSRRATGPREGPAAQHRRTTP